MFYQCFVHFQEEAFVLCFSNTMYVMMFIRYVCGIFHFVVKIQFDTNCKKRQFILIILDSIHFVFDWTIDDDDVT